MARLCSCLFTRCKWPCEDWLLSRESSPLSWSWVDQLIQRTSTGIALKPHASQWLLRLWMDQLIQRTSTRISLKPHASQWLSCLSLQVLRRLCHTLFLLTSTEAKVCFSPRKAPFFSQFLLVLLSFGSITASVVLRGSTLFCLPSPHPSPYVTKGSGKYKQMSVLL